MSSDKSVAATEEKQEVCEFEFDEETLELMEKMFQQWEELQKIKEACEPKYGACGFLCDGRCKECCEGEGGFDLSDEF